jgi:glycosyltransferase involved in cell wall biosynthesis
MRVLHVIPSLSPRLGGPSVGTMQMCQSLTEQGLSVALFTNDFAGGGLSPFRRPAASGVPYGEPVWVGDVEVWYFKPDWPFRFAFSRGMAAALSSTIRSFDIVHIHTLYLFPGLAAAHYARKHHVPYVIQPHGALAPYIRRRHRRLKGFYTWLIESRNLNQAQAIHYASRTEMEQAQDMRIAARSLVVPLAVNISEFERLPARGGIAALYPELAGKQLVVFLGRLAPKKGLNLLVDGFAAIANRFPNAHLVIAGPDEQGVGRQIAARLQKLGMANRSTITGMLVGEAKLSLLADTDVWVLPSYDENFGIAVIEALACGRPVVISDKVNVHPEVSAAGAGLVVSCDANAVAGAIARLLSDNSLAVQLGTNGKRMVAEQFTWDRAARQLSAAYRDWTGSSDRRASPAALGGGRSGNGR